ncbi:DedA family protein [Sphaerisporangium sp. NPDC051017]|uniref:DedA family protein n=1 Tax=Sphaerisporangium sp. NPDC051017 TaxID=3154636 RepID=UPI00341B1D4F
MAPPPLPGPLADLAPLLDRYGYLAVGALVFLEDFGIPVPGETVLIAASVYAGVGRLDIVAVAAVAFLAAVLGDNLGYLIGRTGGRALVTRYGRYVFLTPERFQAAEAFFERRGAPIIVVARFIDGLRQVNGLVAGTTGMPWHRFLLYNVIGAVLWAGTWAGIGYAAGFHITAIYREFSQYQTYFLIAIGVVVVALIARHLLRRRARRRTTPH